MLILRTTEDVFKTVIGSAGITNLPAERVYTGVDSDTIKAPCVVCSATDGKEEIKDSGIYRVRLAVKVKEIAYDTSNQSTLAGDVFNILCDSDFSVFNSVTTYAVYDLAVEDQNNAETGDAWTQTINLDVLCVLTA
jgi:hypothetical protein